MLPLQLSRLEVYLADVVRMGIPEIISFEFLTALPGAAGSGKEESQTSIQGTFIMIGMTQQ